MSAPLLSSLRGVLHHVNANPVSEYGPGELLVVGDYELKARRPEWNLIRNEADGRYYPVRDAAGNPPHPVAVFDLPTLAGYRVGRSDWPEAAKHRAYPADRDETVAWFHPDVPSAPGELRIQSLPVDVFERLAGHTNAGQPNEARVKWYDTRGEADAALAFAVAADVPHVVTG